MLVGVRHRIPADVLLLIIVGIWSCNFSINRYGATHGFDPLAYAGLRYLIAGVIFGAITLKLEGSIRPRREDLFEIGRAHV